MVLPVVPGGLRNYAQIILWMYQFGVIDAALAGEFIVKGAVQWASISCSTFGINLKRGATLGQVGKSAVQAAFTPVTGLGHAGLYIIKAQDSNERIKRTGLVLSLLSASYCTAQSADPQRNLGMGPAIAGLITMMKESNNTTVKPSDGVFVCFQNSSPLQLQLLSEITFLLTLVGGSYFIGYQIGRLIGPIIGDYSLKLYHKIFNSNKNNQLRLKYKNIIRILKLSRRKSFRSFSIASHFISNKHLEPNYNYNFQICYDAALFL